MNGEVKFVKIQKKKIWGRGSGRGVRRIEVFVKIKKEWGGGLVGGMGRNGGGGQ